MAAQPASDGESTAGSAAVVADTVERPEEAAPDAAAAPRIVGGTAVPVDMQRRLGLVTVGTDCSGILLTRKWVLTADHCVGGGVKGGASLSFPDVPIRAQWSTLSVVPTRFVRFFTSGNLDIALIFLGGHDFGPVAQEHFLHTRLISNGAQLQKYGRGISNYARLDPGPPEKEIFAGGKGPYRTGIFTVSNNGTRAYSLFANRAGQVGNGGDSGGPDFLIENGQPTKIVGVQSSCRWTGCLPDRTCGSGAVQWQWVTAIDSCDSNPIFRIRQRIVETVWCNGVRGCSEQVINQILLLGD